MQAKHACDSRAPATTFSQLPESALANILRYVPQDDRLKHCARVGRAWAAAAAVATTDLVWPSGKRYYLRAKGEDMPVTRMESFRAWLEQHAHQVVSVSMKETKVCQHDLQLPPALSQLSHLYISVQQGITLHLSKPSNTGSGVQRTAAGGCSPGVLHPMHARPSVWQLPQLTALVLDHVSFGQEVPTSNSAGQQSSIMARLLQQAPQLAVLKLHHCRGIRHESELAPLSTLQGLRSCSLHGCFPSWSKSLGIKCLAAVCACTSLTELEMGGDQPGITAAIFSTARWRSRLKGLCLFDTVFEPAAVACLQQLEFLEIKSARPCAAQAEPVAPQAEAPAAPVAANPDNHTEPVQPLVASARLTATLLSLPGQLQHLRSFKLTDTHVCAGNVPWDEETAMMPPLGPPYKLEALSVKVPTPNPALPPPIQPLPRRALWHLLAAELRSLTSLELVGQFDPSGNTSGPSGHDWCVDADDIGFIAASCPNLKRLQLDDVVRPCGESLSSLTRLQQQLNLPWLSLAGRCVNDARMAELAQMSSLRTLSITGRWSLGSAFTELGLERLTALRQLTELDAGSSKFSSDFLAGQKRLVIQATPQSVEAGQPDVWSQLDRKLDYSPIWAPKRMTCLREQQAAAEQQHRSEVMALQEQVQEVQHQARAAAQQHQQQVSELLQQVAEQQEELRSLRHQLQQGH